jgi:hypothetical protein
VDETVEARTVLSSEDPQLVHKKAQAYLRADDVDSAWKLLLAGIG